MYAKLRRDPRYLAKRSTAAVTTVTIMSALACSRPAQAQDPGLRALGAFLSIGGYFVQSASANRAIGTPKFYTEAAFFTRPARFGSLRLSGGAEFLGGADHFLFFGGGSGFQSYGGAFRLTTPRLMNRVRPVLIGGLYITEVESTRLNFDVARFSPSLYLGLEFPFARYFTLSAGYRVSQFVEGVNLDGFSLALKFF